VWGDNAAMILKRFQNWRLRNKLMVVLVLFILTPLALSSLIFYQSSADFAAERTDREAIQVLNLVHNNVDQLLINIENRMLDIYDQEDIINQLSKTIGQSNDAGSLQISENSINRFLRNSLQGKDDIDSIYLIAPNQKIYFADVKGSELFKSILAKNPEWRHIVSMADGRVVWLPTYEMPPNDYISQTAHYIPVGMQLKDVTGTLQKIGILMMNVKITALDHIVSGVQVSPHSILLITDNQGNIIWHRNSAAYHIQLNKVPFYKDMISYQHQLASYRINGQPYRIGRVHSDYNNWNYFSLVPQSDLDEQSSSLKRYMIVTFIVFASLFVLLALVTTQSITKPIRHLVAAMKRIQVDNLEFRLQTQSDDEIGMLQSAFNSMSSRINALIQEVKVKTEKEKGAEVRALQAQINPHFVYNTLDAMNWIAMERGQTEISEMIIALSDIMRYAIKGGPLVTMKEELKWAENYAYLQKMRFEERFEIEFAVDQSVLAAKVLRLMLQPYLENAILHGMENMESGGKILVSVAPATDGTAIRIIIRDNGIGISEEKLRRIQERSDHGVGIYNLNDRLKLEYGSEYGVTIESAAGEGSTITILLPFIPSTEE
jgi:two-component system, sensor histidine kinase YesM